MTPEERREQAIQGLARLLRTHPFHVEYKVKKKPAGIKVIIEVTQETMSKIMEKAVRTEEQS